MRAIFGTLRFSIYVLLKSLKFAVSVAFVLIQLVLGFVALVLSLGAIGHSTIDLRRR